MEFSENLTDNPGRFLGLAGKVETQFLHTVENPSLHRFQTIPRIRKCPRHDDGHRIVDIRRTHLLVNIHLFNDALRPCRLFLRDIIPVIFHIVNLKFSLCHKHTNLRIFWQLTKYRTPNSFFLPTFASALTADSLCRPAVAGQWGASYP